MVLHFHFIFMIWGWRVGDTLGSAQDYSRHVLRDYSWQCWGPTCWTISLAPAFSSASNNMHLSLPSSGEKGLRNMVPLYVLHYQVSGRAASLPLWPAHIHLLPLANSLCFRLETICPTPMILFNQWIIFPYLIHGLCSHSWYMFSSTSREMSSHGLSPPASPSPEHLSILTIQPYSNFVLTPLCHLQPALHSTVSTNMALMSLQIQTAWGWGNSRGKSICFTGGWLGFNPWHLIGSLKYRE